MFFIFRIYLQHHKRVQFQSKGDHLFRIESFLLLKDASIILSRHLGDFFEEILLSFVQLHIKHNHMYIPKYVLISTVFFKKQCIIIFFLSARVPIFLARTVTTKHSQFSVCVKYTNSNKV